MKDGEQMARHASPRSVLTAIVAVSLATLLLDSSTASAQSKPGLLDAVNGFVDRMERVFEYQYAPQFELRDLHGLTVSPGTLAGKIAILAFVDQKSQAEAKAWLTDQSLDFLGDPGLVFVNVLYPGSLPFVVSRGKASEQIRTEIDRHVQLTREKFEPAKLERFDRTEIHWVVDWNRELQRDFNVTRGRLNMVVLDGKGRIREIIRKKTPRSTKRLEQLVLELKNGLAAVPAKPDSRRR